LGVGGKVNLVMDNFIWVILEFDWLGDLIGHPVYRGLQCEMLPIVSTVVRAKWACDVLPVRNPYSLNYVLNHRSSFGSKRSATTYHVRLQLGNITAQGFPRG
jgi:hypothetical protein